MTAHSTDANMTTAQRGDDPASIQSPVPTWAQKRIDACKANAGLPGNLSAKVKLDLRRPEGELKLLDQDIGKIKQAGERGSATGRGGISLGRRE